MRTRVEEFHYKIPWRSKGSHPGHHRSTQRGGGFEFRGHAPLLHAPDPRRFDAQASLRDPLESIVMRVYTQRSAIPVYAVADLSASMGFEGRCRKLDVLADFTTSLGYSAYRTGDPFSFIGCDSELRSEFFQPLTRVKGIAPVLAERLRDFTPRGADSLGLLSAVTVLAKRRGLVFLVSDFHFPLYLVEGVLASMSRHTIVPVVLVDSAESTSLPAYGLDRITDAETGARRTLWLRPALRDRIRRAFEQRQLALRRLFLAHGLVPLVFLDRFRAADVTRHFYA